MKNWQSKFAEGNALSIHLCFMHYFHLHSDLLLKSDVLQQVLPYKTRKYVKVRICKKFDFHNTSKLKTKEEETSEFI